MALENNCYADIHDVMCFNNFLQVWQIENGCKIMISFEKAARIMKCCSDQKKILGNKRTSQSCMQNMWLGGQTESFQNVGG